MNSIELRINNWVEYEGNYYQIYDGIRNLSVDHLDSEKLDKHLTNIKIKDLEGIPLTKEIILAIGFKEVEEHIFYVNGKYTIRNTIEDGIYSFEISTSCGYSAIKKIKYLHQLQNLYFEIIGEEIEINLSKFTTI